MFGYNEPRSILQQQMALPQGYRQVAMSTPPGQQRFKIGSSNPLLKDSGASPFISTPTGHSGFVPQKLGKVTTPKLKPPKAPEKPLMPYMRYQRKVWDQVKAQNPELKLWEIGKIIGQMWRDLPDDQKSEFVEDYENEKLEYERNLKVYHNSPAYLAYMAARAKGVTASQVSDIRDERSFTSSKPERRIYIEPAEDDDEPDDSYSVKMVACARYLRNQRLINEIFSDAVVPDVRSVVTTARMQVLNRQVESLTMHQKKLETELLQTEEKFLARKRKFAEASEAFQEELKKHCQRVVDEDMCNKMIERQYELLKKERSKIAITNGGAPTIPNNVQPLTAVEPPSSGEPVATRSVDDQEVGPHSADERSQEGTEGGSLTDQEASVDSASGNSNQ